MAISLTADGDTPVQIQRGQAFFVAVSGGFGGGTLAVQYATAAGVSASLTTAMAGSENDVTLTAIKAGTAGNSYTLTLTDPSANNAELTVTFDGTDIEASLATNESGTITTTANELVAALNLAPLSEGHYRAALAAANDGSGVVTALGQTSFSGGTAGTFVTYSGGLTGNFTSADERNFDQVGETDTINLNVSGSTSPTLTVVVSQDKSGK